MIPNAVQCKMLSDPGWSSPLLGRLDLLQLLLQLFTKVFVLIIIIPALFPHMCCAPGYFGVFLCPIFDGEVLELIVFLQRRRVLI